MIWLIMFLLFVIIVASTWWFGTWNNFITLINLTLSALVASGFYETLARYLFRKFSSYAVLIEFLSAWAVLAITFIVLRTLTDMLSRIRLKFDPITELAARSVLSVSIACVFISFTMFTLHLAPLPPNYFATSKTDDQAAAKGPDKLWVSTIQTLSRGSLSESRSGGLFTDDTRSFVVKEKPYDFGGVRVYYPKNDFFAEYSKFRNAVSQMHRLRN